MRHLLAIAAIALPIAAHAETKTVAWFAAHPDARAKVLHLCRENPGDARHVSNCINADAAEIPALANAIPDGNGEMIDEKLCARMGRLYQVVARCGEFAPR